MRLRTISPAWYNRTGGPRRKQCEAAGSGYQREPTWNWVFWLLGYEIDGGSDGAENRQEPVLGATPTRIINPFDPS